MRMLKERDKVILIGFKWAKGGAWRLAKLLGIDIHNLWSKVLVEGDVKNFDQSVNQLFIKFYMDTMLIHEDPESKDYEVKKKNS